MAEDFFSELGKSISRATRQAVDKTGVFVEATKLTAQIQGQQREIEHLYQKIGENIYRKIRTGEYEPDAELMLIVEEIRKRHGQVSGMRKNLAEVRNMKVCPSCGELIPSDVAFCPKCGTPTPLNVRKNVADKAKKPENEDTDIVAEAEILEEADAADADAAETPEIFSEAEDVVITDASAEFTDEAEEE
jgi:rubrerythrin